MIGMEERVNYLDNIMAELARAQVQSEIAFKASGVRMDALIAKMEADTAKMKEDTARMKESNSRLDEAMLRMEESTARMKEDTARMKEDTARMKEGTARMNEEANARLEENRRQMREDARRMQKAWGDLANKMGTVAEDVVAPNIPRLALEAFGFSEVEDLMVRVRRVSRRGEKRRREWDVVCSGPGKVIVVDVKSTPTLEKIAEVQPRLAEFFDFFPEYEGSQLIGIFASWAIDPQLLPAVSEAGLYGIAMGEETMDIVARPAEQAGRGG